MPRGVHLFDVIRDLHVDERWVREEILQVTAYRYRDLKKGRYQLTDEEAERAAVALRARYKIPRSRLFSKDAEILPPGRCRRSKGTVTTGKEAAA